MEVQDLTNIESETIGDKASFEAEFKSPQGEGYKVVFTELSTDGTHTQSGGVMTHTVQPYDVLSDNLQNPDPTTFFYVMLSGNADVYRDGVLLIENTRVTINIAEKGGIRESAKGEVVKIHLLVTYVPTGIILENGSEQTFIHVNYIENIMINENSGFNLHL